MGECQWEWVSMSLIAHKGEHLQRWVPMRASILGTGARGIGSSWVWIFACLGVGGFVCS